MSKGKLIVLEGLDCCFKETQSHMLSHELKKKFPDKNIELIDFPQYASPSGQLVYYFLHGRYGNPNYLSPQFISDLYSIDRACAWHSDMKKKYDEGYIFIIDRYTYSNCIYQATRVAETLAKNDPYNNMALETFIVGIMNKEFNVYGIPRPDIVLHMSMSISIMKDILSKKKNKDINELDTTFLENCHDMEQFFYEKVMKNDSSIHHILCNIGEEIRTREEINSDIMSVVLPLFEENIDIDEDIN